MTKKECLMVFLKLFAEILSFIGWLWLMTIVPVWLMFIILTAGIAAFLTVVVYVENTM